MARTRPSARRTAAAPAGAGEARLAGRARLRRDRDAPPSGTTRPRSRRGELRTEDIPTEVFFLPAAAHTEKDGSFTNTQRLLQWHHKAVEPPGDCRSDLWFVYHLGRQRPRAAGADSTDPQGPPALDLTWDYPTHGRARGARRRGGAARGQRLRPGRRRSRSSSYTELKDDGSTACGCWIYCGCYADGVNQAARRKPRWRAELGRARMGLGLAGEPPDALQPGLGRSRRGSPWSRAQALRLVGRRAGAAGPATTPRTSCVDPRRLRASR